MSETEKIFPSNLRTKLFFQLPLQVKWTVPKHQTVMPVLHVLVKIILSYCKMEKLNF